IINLCFANDLFLFSRGHPTLVSVIMDALEEFKQVSGLVLSIPKSTAYFCNVPNAIKAYILNLMPFAKGSLPLRYLGVPLISSRLLYRDCKILVEKLESRVNDWRNKFLSLAGRFQLIRSTLGPDGFTTAFFKKSWDVVGGDITYAIRDFFSNGKLLKELNHTIIALIPKVSTPARINDYRPISYCNILYKCISKIIVNRVKEGLGEIVSINQSAFVSGRRIFDNILLTQELMRNYHRRLGPPRCAFKVDI
nr:putative RNA-directed DNA polymerase, eukaryota, reverse transcriptase zinc-binding domain protein [Tanacetum cinerariifolium]